MENGDSFDFCCEQSNLETKSNKTENTSDKSPSPQYHPVRKATGHEIQFNNIALNQALKTLIKNRLREIHKTRSVTSI